MINKALAVELFEKNACLVVDRDVIPTKLAAELTSEKAVEFAKKQGEYNGYGIGDKGTMGYLTRKGFFIAVTYQNVKTGLKQNTF